jgi:spore coat protein CotH
MSSHSDPVVAAPPPRSAGCGRTRCRRPARGSNILVERVTTDRALNALYEQSTTDLHDALFTSGQAQAVLDAWVDVLTEQAADLVDADMVAAEAATISDYLEGTGG